MIPRNRKQDRNRGFTLIELVVSVGIFAIIMMLATGAYLTLINLNRQVQATDAVVTNVSFVIENMTRTIRTGTAYCTTGCTVNSFSFVDTDLDTVTYAVDANNAITRTIGAETDELTDPKTVSITSLQFYPRGYAKNDGIQPSVTIVIQGTANAGSGKTVTFTIQTGATQRSIDI